MNTDIPEKPISPMIRFRATVFRQPEAGEWFWPDGDEKPGPLQFAAGADLSWHNNGYRWILELEQ